MYEGVRGGYQPQPCRNDIIFRSEQLRKLGKLQCYYLDQFNQKESSYTTSNECETALQSKPQRGGSLHPGFVFLGNVQVTWVTPSICVIGLHVNLKYARRYGIFALQCCCVASASAHRRDHSLAAWIARRQYSWFSPDVVFSSSKLHSRRNLSSSARLLGPSVSWCSISLRSSSLCDEMNIPVVRSWTKTHR